MGAITMVKATVHISNHSAHLNGSTLQPHLQSLSIPMQLVFRDFRPLLQLSEIAALVSQLGGQLCNLQRHKWAVLHQGGELSNLWALRMDRIASKRPTDQSAMTRQSCFVSEVNFLVGSTQGAGKAGCSKLAQKRQWEQQQVLLLNIAPD